MIWYDLIDQIQCSARRGAPSEESEPNSARLPAVISPARRYCGPSAKPHHSRSLCRPLGPLNTRKPRVCLYRHRHGATLAIVRLHPAPHVRSRAIRACPTPSLPGLHSRPHWPRACHEPRLVAHPRIQPKSAKQCILSWYSTHRTQIQHALLRVVDLLPRHHDVLFANGMMPC